MLWLRVRKWCGVPSFGELVYARFKKKCTIIRDCSHWVHESFSTHEKLADFHMFKNSKPLKIRVALCTNTETHFWLKVSYYKHLDVLVP